MAIIKRKKVAQALHKEELSIEEISKSISYAQKYGTRISSKCFLPRHALIYYNKQDEIIGTIDICFFCISIKVNPAVADLSEEEMYEGCNINTMKPNKKVKPYFNYFEKLVKQKGLPYFEEEEDWFNYELK